MFGDRDTPQNNKAMTKESPKYNIFSSDMAVSIVTGSVLMVLTIGTMLAFANTFVAELVLSLYNLGAIVGVIVIGGLLSVGRHLGIKGIESNNIAIGVFGSIISVMTYGVFGAAILTQYVTDIYGPAILTTSFITMSITLVAGMIVFKSSRSFEFARKYSAVSFIAGFILSLIGTILTQVLILAFVCFFVGFILDLVYELWALSDSKRSPLTNGLTLYIAFAGVFVHILMMVLEYYSD